MTNGTALTFGAAVLIILLVTACGPKGRANAADPPPSLETKSEAAPPSAALAEPPIPDGKALVESRCVVCHDLKRVDAKKTDASGWGHIVDTMIKKGAKLDVAERAAVLDYLTNR